MANVKITHLMLNEPLLKKSKYQNRWVLCIFYSPFTPFSNLKKSVKFNYLRALLIFIEKFKLNVNIVTKLM